MISRARLHSMRSQPVDAMNVSEPNRRGPRVHFPAPCSLFFLLIGLVAGFAQFAAAQDAPAVGSDNEPRAVAPSPRVEAPPNGVPAHLGELSGRIQYVGPDTYILIDAEGRPQPVPGMTYEDFMAAWKEAHKIDPHSRQPRYAIESVEFHGRTKDQTAELQVEIALRLLTDEPVDVPLGLIGAILKGQPRFERRSTESTGNPSGREASHDAASDDEFLDYQPDHGGFVARFVGRPSERHILTLDLLVPLSRNGAETTLPLNCPRTFVSNLTLDVNPAASDASVSNGTLLSRFHRRRHTAHRGRFCRSISPDVEIGRATDQRIGHRAQLQWCPPGRDRRTQRPNRRSADRPQLRRKLRWFSRSLAAWRYPNSGPTR